MGNCNSWEKEQTCSYSGMRKRGSLCELVSEWVSACVHACMKERKRAGQQLMRGCVASVEKIQVEWGSENMLRILLFYRECFTVSFFNYFKIKFTPNKAAKPWRRNGLLGVEELETGTLLRSENIVRAIRMTAGSDWHGSRKELHRRKKTFRIEFKLTSTQLDSNVMKFHRYSSTVLIFEESGHQSEEIIRTINLKVFI